MGLRYCDKKTIRARLLPTTSFKGRIAINFLKLCCIFSSTLSLSNSSMGSQQKRWERIYLWLPRAGGGRQTWSLGLADANNSNREWISNKVLLYSTRNYIQHPVENNRKRIWKRMYIHSNNHFTIQYKLTQHCKSIILRLNKISKKGLFYNAFRIVYI